MPLIPMQHGVIGDDATAMAPASAAHATPSIAGYTSLWSSSSSQFLLLQIESARCRCLVEGDGSRVVSSLDVRFTSRLV